jgi:choice-of-anchor B domain-containing protein
MVSLGKKKFMKKLYSLLLILMPLAVFSQAPQFKNMTFRSQLPYPGMSLSNIGGFVDTLGNEYALVGTSEGLSIVDVTDPDNPFELQAIPGPNSIWREVKTWGRYAYVTTEGGAQGLQILDLRNLPNPNVPFQNWNPTVNGQTLETIHALHIDNGYVYLYGSNNGNASGGGIDGIVIADLADPWNPTVAGVFNGDYVHDGYVRNDTVWACHIYTGNFSAIDVSDKANPVVLATQFTPKVFAHNSWLSDNSKYLFTTDEVDGSFLAAYDVEVVSNIQEVDRILSQNPTTNSIVHNTHVLNDYAVTSWYKDGVVTTDVHRPQNLVHVGWYDTSPQVGGGFAGCWGVYPYLPSGTIVASDMEEGLFVLTPNYVRACYLEGFVTDSVCGDPISNVTITVSGAGITDSTDLQGEYRNGTPDAGTYTVTFSKPGYITKVVNGVVLSTANVTNLNVFLAPVNAVNLSGLVEVSGSTTGIPNANVIISNGTNAYNYVSDANGNFTQCGLAGGNYDVIAGKWGYETFCGNQALTTGNLAIDLVPGIYDDFSFANAWTVSGNASAGVWERAIPAATDNQGAPANPGSDESSDCSNRAYVTGNNNANASVDDIDNGATILSSPLFDLTGFNAPSIRYARWFYNGGGTGATPNDSLVISISNGITSVDLETVTLNTPGMSSWVQKQFDLTGVIASTANMQIKVRAVDANPGHLVEAGFDHFRVEELDGVGLQESLSNNSLEVYPNPAQIGITLVSQSGFESVRILNTLGGVALQQNFSSVVFRQDLSVETLAKGIYILEVSNAKGMVSRQSLLIK